MRKITKPSFKYEQKSWQKGCHFVVGIDEVGRGSFAGPVVVGAVVFPPNILEVDGVNDSKLLKPRFRELMAKTIKEKALAYDISEVRVSVINKIGIGKATEKAMRKTVKDLEKKGVRIDCVLIDHFNISYLPGFPKAKQIPVTHGDKLSFSIAAASILAKVYRDKIMLRLSKKPRYKKYGWGRNKGYGTKEHGEAILKNGLTRLHRKKYVQTWLIKKEKRGTAL